MGFALAGLDLGRTAGREWRARAEAREACASSAALVARSADLCAAREDLVESRRSDWACLRVACDWDRVSEGALEGGPVRTYLELLGVCLDLLALGLLLLQRLLRLGNLLPLVLLISLLHLLPLVQLAPQTLHLVLELLDTRVPILKLSFESLERVLQLGDGGLGFLSELAGGGELGAEGGEGRFGGVEGLEEDGTGGGEFGEAGGVEDVGFLRMHRRQCGRRNGEEDGNAPRAPRRESFPVPAASSSLLGRTRVRPSQPPSSDPPHP